MSKYIKEKEIWKVYKDTRGSRNGKGSLWEVSTFGHVRRNKKNFTPRIGTGGYLYFSGWSLYRAVAELFIPNIENKPEIDHIDRDKSNNRASNLRWVTHSENMANIDKETFRKKLSEANKGKRLSEDHKRKLIEAHKGKPSPLIGRHHTEETKQKMAEKRREYWQKKKESL